MSNDYVYDEYEEDYTDESESGDDFEIQFFQKDFDIPFESSGDESLGDEYLRKGDDDYPRPTKQEYEALANKKGYVTIKDRLAMAAYKWKTNPDIEVREEAIAIVLRWYFKGRFEKFNVPYDKRLVERAIRAFFVRVHKEGESVLHKLDNILHRSKDTSGLRDYKADMQRAVATGDAQLLLSSVYELSKNTLKNQKKQKNANKTGACKPSRNSMKQRNPDLRDLPLAKRKEIDSLRIMKYHYNAEYRKQVDEEKAKRIAPFTWGGGKVKPYKRAPDPKTRVLKRTEKHCKRPYCMETDIDTDGYCKQHRGENKNKGTAPVKRPSESNSDSSSAARDELFEDMMDFDEGPSSRPASLDEYRRRAERWADVSLWKHAKAAAIKDREHQAAAEEKLLRKKAATS